MDLEPPSAGAMPEELGHQDARRKEYAPADEHESAVNPRRSPEITAGFSDDGGRDRWFQAGVPRAIGAAKRRAGKRVPCASNGDDGRGGVIGRSDDSGHHPGVEAIFQAAAVVLGASGAPISGGDPPDPASQRYELVLGLVVQAPTAGVFHVVSRNSNLFCRQGVQYLEGRRQAGRDVDQTVD